MGSFASTCCISGLSIEVGDAVRYLLLTENPYCDGGFVCYPYGRWVPRTWPIKAKYNDYGSIENWEEGAVQRSFLSGLQKDMIEVGVGDNSIHDVATSVDMSFDQMLEAVWQGRIIVSSEPGRNELNQRVKEHLSKIDKLNGVPENTRDWNPTIQNVSEVISQVNIPEGCRYLVDEKDYWIRVRWDGLRGEYGKDNEYLDKAKSYIEDRFAVVATASADINTRVELRCFPYPTPEGERKKERPNFHVSKDGSWGEKDKTLLVQQAMIREDVWQALLKLPLESWQGKKTVDTFRLMANKFVSERRELYDKLAKLDSESKEAKELRRDIQMLRYGGRNEMNEFVYLAAKELVPFNIGLSSHAEIVIESDDCPEDFGDLLGEFHFIYSILHGARHVWRPSDTCGPQFAEMESHAKYLSTLAEVAQNIHDKWKEEYGDEEEDWEDEE